ncbi:MAG: SCP2 sterol-binding domain-containing protein [Desulfomonilaceae bacterium]
MKEVRVLLGSELNGLGMTIKQLIDQNLVNPKIRDKAKKLKGSLVIREAETGIAVTIFFRKGELQIQNDIIEKPSAHLEAGFDSLAEISSGEVGPIKALLTRRIKAGGNLLKLLKMSQVLICKEESQR